MQRLVNVIFSLLVCKITRIGKEIAVKTSLFDICRVKLGDKKRLDKEQNGLKEPFSLTNLTLYFIMIRH